MSIINGKLITPVGAPKSLIFDLPSSMINATKTENRIQPYGQSKFETAGTVIRIVIPRTDRALINPQTGYLVGKMAFTVPAGATAGTDQLYIIGSHYSMFSKQVISSNGRVLETIENPSQLANVLFNTTLGYAQRLGLATTMGFSNSSSNVSYPINTSATAGIDNIGGSQKEFSFAICLLGLLNCNRQLPLINGDVTIELTLNSPSNYLLSNTAAGKAVIATTTFAMTEVEYVVDQLTLTPESYAMVMANYPERLYIKSQSYDYGSYGLASGSSSQDIPVNIKRSSAKQMIVYFQDSRGTDGTYGGVNPNGDTLQFITNGVAYPSRGIKLHNPSEVFNQVQKATGSLYSGDHCGNMDKYCFARRMDANNFYTASVQTVTDGENVGNKFYLIIDLETINYDSDSLYSGLALGVNSNFRLNCMSAIPSTANCYFWICYDAVIEMDLINGITSVIA